MSKERGWLWMVLIIAIGAALWYRQSVFQQANTQESTSVAFITGGTGPYWQMTVAGAQAAAEKYNAELDVIMPEQSEGLAEQTKLIIGVDKESVDGIAISPVSAKAQTHLINKIVQKLPVVTFDADAPLSNRHLYVGASNYAAGQLCHKLIAEALPEGGQVIALAATLSKNNISERKLGLEEAIADRGEIDSENGIELLDVLVDDGSLEVCGENIRQAMQSNPNIAGIVALNGYQGEVILEVLEDQKKLGEIKVVAFDEANKVLNGIADGHIHATVAQDPYMYGFQAVRMLTELNHGRYSEVPIVGGGAVNVQCEPVRQDNLADFRKRLEERMNGAKQSTDSPKAESQADDSDLDDSDSNESEPESDTEVVDEAAESESAA